MNSDYNWDIYDTFKEQLDIQIPKIEKYILCLTKQDTMHESIDDLFRLFHSYKANTEYLSLLPFHELSSKVESILGTLREERQSSIEDSVIQWLLEILDTLSRWSLEMDIRTIELSKVPTGLLERVVLNKSNKKPADILQTLNILYVDSNTQRISEVLVFLEKYCSNISLSSSLHDAKTQLNEQKQSIIIANLNNQNKENDELVNYILSNFINLPIITIYDSVTSLSYKELLSKGINHILTNPLSSKHMYRELINVVQTHYSSSTLIIDHKKILNFIENLEPLQSTIFQILQVCDDEDIPVKDLISIIKTDPIMSANILHLANSPLYGNVTLSTIDQAVVKFGKRMIKSLAMSGLYQSIDPLNFQAYKITETQFSEVSMTRLALMIKWYSKVSISDLTLLSSTAVLGNIGQILIANELSESKNIEEFQNLCSSSSIEHAEESLLHTNTNITSSQILSYWKLPSDIVDIISYTNNPDEAPDDLKHLCAANNIVYTMVGLDGVILQEIPDETLFIMAQYNLDPLPLENALKLIIE